MIDRRKRIKLGNTYIVQKIREIFFDKDKLSQEEKEIIHYVRTFLVFQKSKYVYVAPNLPDPAMGEEFVAKHKAWQAKVQAYLEEHDYTIALPGYLFNYGKGYNVKQT